MLFWVPAICSLLIGADGNRREPCTQGRKQILPVRTRPLGTKAFCVRHSEKSLYGVLVDDIFLVLQRCIFKECTSLGWSSWGLPLTKLRIIIKYSTYWAQHHAKHFAYTHLFIHSSQEIFEAYNILFTTDKETKPRDMKQFAQVHANGGWQSQDEIQVSLAPEKGLGHSPHCSKEAVFIFGFFFYLFMWPLSLFLAPLSPLNSGDYVVLHGHSGSIW